MPIYKMQAPNGKMYEIEGPEGASEEDVRAEILRRDPAAGGDTPVTPVSPTPPTPPAGRTVMSELAKGAGNVIEGIGDVVGMVNDPFATALGRTFGYDNYTADTGKTVREATGLPEDDSMAGAIVRGASGGLGFSGAARGLAAGATGLGRAALSELAATPVLDTVSGATGAGSSEIAEDLGFGAVGQTVAGLVGGLGPYAVGRGVHNIRTGVDDAGRPYEVRIAEDGSESISYMDSPQEGLTGEVTDVSPVIDDIDPEVAAFQQQWSQSVEPSVQAPEGVSEPVADAVATEPSEDLVTRLTTALKGAEKLTADQQLLYRQERAKRFARVKDVQGKTSGEEGFKQELAQLKGEMEKVEFESIRDSFSEEEVTQLFNSVRDNPDLRVGESLTARTGLSKLLKGSVPTPGELTQLSKVFPADFIKGALDKRATLSKINSVAANIMNLPRAMMSTADVSAPLRQGVFMIGRKEFWPAYKSMFKQFASEDAHRAVQADIESRPTYDLMSEHRLAVRDSHLDLTTREEQFVTDWAEKIPGFGKIARASNRAYSGFLHKLRADVFDDILSKNPEMSADPKQVQALANYVNAATGRGKLPPSLEQAAPVLNGLFFSPRLISSRLTLMNPEYYVTLPPAVRKEAISDLMKFGTTATTVLALGAAGGMDVEIDPRSSDFAKLKAGDRRYDILGGFQQYMRLGAVMAPDFMGGGARKTLKGDIKEFSKEYGSDNRLTTLFKFGRNKLSPIAGYIATALAGTNPVGEDFEPAGDAAKLFIPMFLSDMVEAMNDEGVEGVLKTAPASMGIGIQNIKPRNKTDEFGRDTTKPREDTPVVATIKELGGIPAVQKTIAATADREKLKLTDEQFEKYQTLVGQWIQEDVAEEMASEEWGSLSTEEKKEILKKISKDARADAREELFEPQQEEAIEEWTLNPESVQ